MSNTIPSASPSRSRSSSPPQQHHQQDDQPQHHDGPQQRLKVYTHHCRFCNHLLLATTRTIASLPRREPPAQDNALILPLPHDDDDDDEEELDEQPDAPSAPSAPETNTLQNTEEQGQGQGERKKRKQKHTTILLSTTLPDRKASLIRREDGFEKRRFVRCGRCRVVMGYFLDAVHFPVPITGTAAREDGGEGEGIEQEPRVVYLLPGALMETEDMGDEEKMRVMDREWSGWIQ